MWGIIAGEKVMKAAVTPGAAAVADPPGPM
jgi:hypothetical protein